MDHEVSSSGSPEPPHNVRVLLVDDEPDWLELASHFLEQSGMQVRTAASVSEAMEQLNVEVADVLVSDLGMPDEDGFELIRKVRRCVDPGRRALRALALTAFVGEGYRDQALDLGFDAVMSKPVRLPQLVSLIGELAGKEPQEDRGAEVSRAC